MYLLLKLLIGVLKVVVVVLKYLNLVLEPVGSVPALLLQPGFLLTKLLLQYFHLKSFILHIHRGQNIFQRGRVVGK